MEFIPTNLPFENQYPKLVRDNIPDIIKERDNREVPLRLLTNDSEYLLYLTKKLTEESLELQYALERGNFGEEMADVFEVIYAILKVKNMTIEDVVAIQKEKREKNGGFEKRILMLNSGQGGA